MSLWLLLLFGFLLLIGEIFLPGGVVGLIGLVLMVVAVVLISKEQGSIEGLLAGASALLLGFGAFYLAFKSPLSKFWILSEQLGRDDQSSASTLQPGTKGTTITDLRPSGKAVFVLDGKEIRLDVLTEGEFLEKDRLIEIVRLEGPRITVRPLA